MDRIKPLFTATATATGGRNGHTEASDGTVKADLSVPKEIETLRSPARVERIATKDLHLVAPTRDQAIILERVTPSAPPEKSIVAAR